ncbi:IucA/IucC family protein [Paenibacillus hexagrammi]|uniref:IucA/IucC family siderophore biosynthesis protein n=1 Tax=Paenibacillus hexagrammi TaxID=2908839 RepID=A0ABY3SSV3_9BACL|nr:IucA/IucC family protein [Paenibacillus sp. YPD9-1]UJF36354.1 IucA/IucC family siderophore biosynthesis protein [Paenibacillus sp. YPD9-1]
MKSEIVSYAAFEYMGKVERRVLGQLVEAVLYEGIAVPVGGLPKEAGTSRNLALQGISAAGEPVEYRLTCTRKWTFDRFRIVRESIIRRSGEEESSARLDLFVEEVLGQVQQGEKLSMLLEELEHTLLHDVQAQMSKAASPCVDVQSSYQEIESRLDGHPYHPCYKSRIGFSLQENALYGPEFRQGLKPVWLAIASSHSEIALLSSVTYRELLEEELGSETEEHFKNVLQQRGLQADDYLFMPVHPWQWEHMIMPVCYRQIADCVIVLLGSGPDVYRAQQSIRSWSNDSVTKKATIKMALHITNTSTKRVLARHTVLNAPLVSDWLLAVTRNDETARRLGVVFLTEFAGITFDYEKLPLLTRSKAYSSIGVIWRQSVDKHLQPGESAIPLNALTYIEADQPLIDPWLQKYGVEAWTRELLNVTVTPIIHMLYAHGLAMESHAQNMVLIHREGKPMRLALKDFHDGLRFSKSHLTEPDACPALHAEPAHHRAMNRHSYMQTEDLSSVRDFVHSAFFFVCLGDLALFFNERYGVEERVFWQMTSEVIERYQGEHPQHAINFERYDLFSETIRIEQLTRRRLWKDADVEPKAVPNPLYHYRRVRGGKA